MGDGFWSTYFCTTSRIQVSVVLNAYLLAMRAIATSWSRSAEGLVTMLSSDGLRRCKWAWHCVKQILRTGHRVSTKNVWTRQLYRLRARWGCHPTFPLLVSRRTARRTWLWKSTSLYSERCDGPGRQTRQKPAEADTVNRGHIEEGVLDEEHTASILKVIDVVVHKSLVHRLILFWRSWIL